MVLYGILIRVYVLLIWFTSFYSEKSKRWIQGRKNWKNKLSDISFEGKWIWFHCSSFGEFNDGKVLLESIKRKYPNYKILLTFFSTSGYEAVKNYQYADAIFYLPLDTKTNAEYFIRKINPSVVFFVRNDIWPNYLIELSKRKIPIFLHSFTLSDNSNFLRFPQRNFYRSVFNIFTAIFVHNELSYEILMRNNFSKAITVTGNARIDTVIQKSFEKFHNERIINFIAGNFCVIAGSTHARDREIFFNTILKLSYENIKWIIAPHEIDRGEIDQARNIFMNKLILFSDINNRNEEAILLWIDSVGLLARIYRYADLAFVGGGFIRSGIHSILEPAAYGCPVCFGPNHRNYTEAMDMLRENRTEIIYDERDLQNLILKLKNNKDLMCKIKILNYEYIRKNAGATEMVIKFLEKNMFLN